MQEKGPEATHCYEEMENSRSLKCVGAVDLQTRVIRNVSFNTEPKIHSSCMLLVRDGNGHRIGIQ